MGLRRVDVRSSSTHSVEGEVTNISLVRAGRESRRFDYGARESTSGICSKAHQAVVRLSPASSRAPPCQRCEDTHSGRAVLIKLRAVRDIRDALFLVSEVGSLRCNVGR